MNATNGNVNGTYTTTAKHFIFKLSQKKRTFKESKIFRERKIK